MFGMGMIELLIVGVMALVVVGIPIAALVAVVFFGVRLNSPANSKTIPTKQDDAKPN